MGSGYSSTRCCKSFYCRDDPQNKINNVSYVYSTDKPKCELNKWWASDTTDLYNNHEETTYHACSHCYKFIPDQYKDKFIFQEKLQEYNPL